MFLKRLPILILFIFYLASQTSHAAGIMARVQQKKMMQQQQSQQQYLEDQQYQQAQASGQQGQQQQQATGPLTYQQTIDQRNQAIAQSITNANNKGVSVDNNQPVNNAAANPVSQHGPAAIGASNQNTITSDKSGVNAQSMDVKDVVDLSEVWKKLDKKSTVWTLLIDNKDKVLTTSEYIDRFRKQGVKINQAPSYYVDMIDKIVDQNPQMLQRPFSELLQIAAIVDYDFDNGIDKDLLARKVLGEQGFEANKRRFGQ